VDTSLCMIDWEIVSDIVLVHLYKVVKFSWHYGNWNEKW